MRKEKKKKKNEEEGDEEENNAATKHNLKTLQSVIFREQWELGSCYDLRSRLISQQRKHSLRPLTQANELHMEP
jgi:hypothetical protein